jgi:hypothetical protein
VLLASRVEYGASVVAEVPNFVRRTTLLRVSEGGRFALWPAILDGPEHDERYTAQLVYTSLAEDAPPAADPLWTLGGETHRVTLIVTPSLYAFEHHTADLEAAADEMNAVLAPDLTYVVSREPPGTGTVIDVRYDEASPYCTNSLAFTRLILVGNKITGGEIVYCSPDAVTRRVAVHEVGHTFGLRHSPDPFDIMQAYAVADPSRQRPGFGDAEALTMRMMRQRRPGNRFPDDDTQVLTSAGERSVVLSCPRGGRP